MRSILVRPTCYDSLTEQDLETIRRYIKHNARTNVINLKPVLSSWNANKRTLFKGLGKQLRVTVPITIERNQIMFYNQIKELYAVPYQNFVYDFKDNVNIDNVRKHIHNDFVFSFFQYYATKVIDNSSYYNDRSEFYNLINLFTYSCIEENKTFNKVELTSCGLSFQAGTRPMRAIQKVIKKIGYPHLDLFEEWRNAISNMCSNRAFKGNLTLSIHPLDFMTLSDNNCNWTSCMNWREGSYSIGTIEMMNSNCAMVAYLNSDTEFAPHDLPIPNKSWRALLFAHKNILIVGKNYPYHNKSLEQQVLKEASSLLKKNLNWDYRYKEQYYKDLHLFNSNAFVRENLNREKMTYTKDGNTRHKIICYTNIMYNDMMEDQDSEYMCYRNKPKKTLFLNLSGPVTCLCCGKPHDIPSWYVQGVYDHPVCSICKTNICQGCGQYMQPEHLHDKDSIYVVKKSYKICLDCCETQIYLPTLDKFITKEDYHSRYCSVVFRSQDSCRSKRVSKNIIDFMTSRYYNPLRKNEKYHDFLSYLDLHQDVLFYYNKSSDTLDSNSLTISDEYFDLLLEIVRKEEINETSTTI